MHKFNTGRQYGPAGQIIVWETLTVPDGDKTKDVVWFHDCTRGIWGEIDAPAFGDATDRYVRACYDHNNYRYSPGDNYLAFAKWVRAALDVSKS